jgi:RimJ/RimL family protein N-acetyltransferase
MKALGESKQRSCGDQAMIALREYSENDLPLLVEYLNNANVTKYLTASIPQPYTEENARWWVSEGSKAGIVRAIQYENRFVGTVGATPGLFERSRSAETGYWLAEPFWGKGIATAALGQLTNLVFQSSEIVRLHAQVFSGNAASMRVLEKCGYKQEALLTKAAYKNGVYLDTFLYAAIKP